MRFVSEALFPPYVCAVTGVGAASTSSGELLDTGSNTPRGERIYVSQGAFEQMAERFDYLPGQVLRDEIQGLRAEAARLAGELEAALEQVAAVRVLEGVA